MTVTVKDVAKKAGVAASTVSRVINDQPSISDATKKKVHKVMDELGYVPNIAARNLGKKITNAVGVVLPPLDSRERIGNPFYLEIIDAINEEARAHQMTIALATAKSFDLLLQNVQQMHKQRQVDGFILLYSDSADPVVDYLYQEGIPFTLIGQPYQHEEEIVYVNNDNQLLGRHATDYLLKNGHKEIVFITNTTHENVYYDRYFGYQKAMMLAGSTVQPSLDLERPEDFSDFLDTLTATKATAAVVIDDVFAVRVIQLAQMHGLKVPEDLSLISFNNSIFATLVHPYLTSLDIHIAELGKAAMEKIAALVHGNKTSGSQLIVPHELVQRETVLDLNRA